MQDLFVKICGITNLEDARMVVNIGANAVGFIFYKGSERYISPETAGEIGKKLPEHVTKVGVFVHDDRKSILDVAKRAGLSAVQLVGGYAPDDLFGFEASVIKVFRIGRGFEVETIRNFVVDAYLLDTHRSGVFGGTGETFDWNIAVKAKEYGKVILSGGLTPENIEAAVRFVRPYGVDVSSGVESRPGKKNQELVTEFIARARSAQQSIE